MQVDELNLTQCTSALAVMEEMYTDARGCVDLIWMSKNAKVFAVWIDIRKRQSKIRKAGVLKDVKFVSEGEN